MRVALIPLLAMAACRPGTDEVARQRLAHLNKLDPERPVSRVEIVPIEDGLYLAIQGYENSWCGFFDAFSYRRGRFRDLPMSTSPDEGSVRKVRGFRLPGHPRLIVEVFGMTHMGNGSGYIYELREEGLDLLLRTRAVDAHDDGILFRGGMLEVGYGDLDGDGQFDLEFKGIVDEREPARSYPCSKAFLWRDGRFVEDRSRRSGLDKYAWWGE